MGIRKGPSDIKARGEKMRSYKFPAFVLFLAGFSSACSSSSETATKSSGSNSNSAVPAVASQNRDSNAGTVNTGQRPNPRDKRGSTSANRIDVNPTGTPLSPQFHPAAENSESAITMNRDGSVTEIRVFKSHPQLAKVEATSFGTNGKQVKFYLRSGKVLEVKTDHLGNLQTVTTKELLAIAGTK